MKAYLDWKHLSFAHPLFFLLLVLIPVIIWWHYNRKNNENPVFRLTTLWGIKAMTGGSKAAYRPVLFWLRIIAFIMLI